MAFVGRLIPGPERATKGRFRTSARMLDLEFVVEGRWNTREEFWMCTVYDPTNRPIVRDIAALCDEDILENVIRPYAPQGAIVVRDRTEADRDPGRDGWSEGNVLRYEYEVADDA